MRPGFALLVALAAASSALAVGRWDLAVESVRAPSRVSLDDRHPTGTRRAAVRIANRGSVPAVLADAAAVAATVRLTATAAKGPIVCAPLGVTPARHRFPLAIRPGRSVTLPYDLRFLCGPNPDRTPDWTLGATVDHAALDGNADEDPGDDTCPRPPTATDPGCGVAPTIDVRDGRAGTRFELPGPYGVGTTSLTLVDASRPTMANGSFPGAPERTLPTAVWYPSAPGASGADAPLAADGRPFPLVVFGHALGSYDSQSTFLMTHLASHGYVVAAPTFPLMHLNAPGGATIADVAAQAGDVHFVIDSFLGFAREDGNRFVGGIDADRVAVSGHSGGAITMLVATYDRNLRDPRIRAVVPFAPPSCFLQPGYFDAASVPLLILQGDHDLLVDAVADSGAAFARARPPKALVIVHGGTHIGFADVGAGVADDFVCRLFPDGTELTAEIGVFLEALGGAADHVGMDGCPSTYCAGDTTHIDGLRQQQIGKETALAFFEAVLRGDRTARRYVATLAARNPDVSLTQKR